LKKSQYFGFEGGHGGGHGGGQGGGHVLFKEKF